MNEPLRPGAPDTTYTIHLPFAAPCSICNSSQPISPGGHCLVCGTELPPEAVAAVRAALRRRRTAFKGRLDRLEQRMRRVTESPLRFTTRGVPAADDDYRDRILRPTLDSLPPRSAQLARLFAAGTWDPEESGCIGAFETAIGILDRGLDLVENLRGTLPPIGWRAVHRELTRAASEQARGQVLMASAISAPDLASVRDREGQSNEALRAGLRHAERASALLGRMGRIRRDGPFQEDGSLDLAAAAWASVSEEPLTIAEAAQLVRRGFAEIRGVPQLPDERVIGLLPSLALSASTVDFDVLVRRTSILRDSLDTADGTPWIDDPTLLVQRIGRGVERIFAEAQRLGHDVRTNVPRAHMMRSLIEAYRQFMEGPLRDLGGVFVIGARASRREDNGQYVQPVVDAVQAGEVVTELDRLGPMFRDAVEMLYRNASAHASVEILDQGIVATDTVVKGGKVVSSRTREVSDAEFAEDVVAQQELLLAMQMAILPWVSTHGDAAVAAAVDASQATMAEACRGLVLLAGIAGLGSVSVSVNADHILLQGTPTHPDVGTDTTRLLSLVPAALGAYPDAKHVTLHVVGLQPVEYARHELAPDAADDVPHRLPLVGLFSAKWLRESGARWSASDEATFVTMSLTIAHFDSAKFASATPIAAERIDRAVESLRIVRQRLDEVLPSERSPLTDRAADEMGKLEAALGGLAAVHRGLRPMADGLRLAQLAARTLDSMLEVQEAAKALRDSSSPSAPLS